VPLGVAITVVVAAIYVVTSHFSAFWATGGRASSPIYPGVGAALAAVLLFGRQYWPSIFAARLLAFWFVGSTRQPWLVIAIAGANALTAWAGGWGLMRWGLDPALSRLRDVLWLSIGGGLVSSVIGATAGVSAMALAGDVATANFMGTWMRWWVGSIGGVLVVTPLALAWGAGDPLPRSLRYWVHLLACVLAVSGVSAWVFFGAPSALGRTWIVWPALLWSSLVFGVRGATLALLPATVISVAGTIMGTGVLARTLEQDVRFVLLQQFLMAASFTCLMLAVVADERRGKQALRDREQRLHLALAAARSFSFELEPRTGVVVRTSESAEILGLPAADAVHGTADVFMRGVHEDDRPQFADALANMTPAHPKVRLAYRFHRPDGGVVHIDESAVATFDDKGRLARIVGVSMDVTDRRLAEQEREALLAREQAARLDAEQAMLLRDEFLGTVSHELRTPLNAILGWAQILQAGPRTADALQSGLATIARNARLQTQLIDDLLDLSRMSAGRLRLDAQPVDLAATVRDAVLAVTPAASARSVHVHQDAIPATLLVMGDAERLQQVFWNLLVNAVKFTEPGGEVRVHIDQDDEGLRVRVSDTGTGITPDFLPHVFDRFRQADGSTTRRHSGLGIGLALVRQLVELHGGSVRAESPGEGRGATFTVHLPAWRSLPSFGAANGGGAASFTSPPRPGLTVLVVDDDADTREIARHFLEGVGARVVTATNADEGLQLLRAERPDVLVADIGMPGTDGYAFIRAVRALSLDDGCETPAIALTALVRDEDRRRAIEAGFQSHLAKPITREALVSTVSLLHPPRSRA
jgi:signal transduction histidine kinase/CheY-like chemotaxis protein